MGKIDELVIDPETHRRYPSCVASALSYLNKWIVTIPVSAIERADSGYRYYLKIDKAAVEALPAVALKKFPWE